MAGPRVRRRSSDHDLSPLGSTKSVIRVIKLSMSDRKYRQSGYQDSGRGGSSNEGRSRPTGGPRDRGAGPPRGRGLGKPTETVFRCAVCGQQAVIAQLRDDSDCVQCGAPFHTCTHCQFFDTSEPGECRQKEADYVASKAKRNTCSYFEHRTTLESPREADNPKDAKSAFDALFNI